MDARGISPVVGTVLVVAITLLLASVFAVGATGVVEFDTERDLVGELTDGDATVVSDDDDEDDEDDD